MVRPQTGSEKFKMRSIREAWISKTITELFELKEYAQDSENDARIYDLIKKSTRMHEIHGDTNRVYSMGFLNLREYSKVLRAIGNIQICMADRLADICDNAEIK